MLRSILIALLVAGCAIESGTVTQRQPLVTSEPDAAAPDVAPPVQPDAASVMPDAAPITADTAPYMAQQADAGPEGGDALAPDVAQLDAAPEATAGAGQDSGPDAVVVVDAAPEATVVQPPPWVPPPLPPIPPGCRLTASQDHLKFCAWPYQADASEWTTVYLCTLDESFGGMRDCSYNTWSMIDGRVFCCRN